MPDDQAGHGPATPHLFRPLALRGVTLKNRIVVSPMCQYKAIDGAVSDWHLAHHARFALGGVGSSFVEATGVTPEGRITPGCTGIWDDSQIEGLARIAALYRTYGGAPGIQLAHAGRKASAARPWDGAGPLSVQQPAIAWQAVAPSPIPYQNGWPAPRELSESEIDAVVEAFAAATRRSVKAGFDLIEIHGAHGYLIHSFLSPLSNRRTDAYGGDLANRMRLALRVAEAVRGAMPSNLPLFYRVSSIDGAEGGLTIEDTTALARELKARGVDVMDCSSGGVAGSPVLASAGAKPGYQVPYAAAMRKGAGIATMAVGLIVDPRQAEAIVAGGHADLVALARELMADPAFVHRCARILGLANPHAVLPLAYDFYLQRRKMAPLEEQPAIAAT
jgi:2,4-dienoyl-CoA reductase-like NADH-dependent reductase (Old Yellow Enzyme family)